MDTKEFQHNNKQKTRMYKGIEIYAAEGLHEKAMELVFETKVEKNSNILILGSGGGAFDKRLIDYGYKNITSIDYIGDLYKVNGTKFIQKDLNDDFYDLGNFDLIIALEIIEHLENPFKFIRNCNHILNNGGYFILSSPNINGKFHRIWFALFDEMLYFNDSTLFGTGHISPQLNSLLKYNLSYNKFEILKIESSGNTWKLGINSLRSLFSSLVMRFLMFFVKGNDAYVNIYLSRKK